MYAAIEAYRDIITMLITGIAVSCATVALAWPYLYPDVLGARKRRLVDAWQWNRLSTASRPVERPKHSLLASEPRRIRVPTRTTTPQEVSLR